MEAKQAHLQVQPCGILVQDGEGSLVGDLERGTVQGDEVFAAGVGVQRLRQLLSQCVCCFGGGVLRDVLHTLI